MLPRLLLLVLSSGHQGMHDAGDDPYACPLLAAQLETKLEKEEDGRFSMEAGIPLDPSYRNSGLSQGIFLSLPLMDAPCPGASVDALICVPPELFLASKLPSP